MIAWFLTTKIGRFILGIAGVLAAFGAAYLKGRSDQKVSTKLGTIKDIEKAKEISNEVDALSSDDLRERASKWVRP